MDKKFSELEGKDKIGLVKGIMIGLPFPEYWVHKTLSEVNPIIHNAHLLPKHMYIDDSCVRMYFEHLFVNLDYEKLSSTPPVEEKRICKECGEREAMERSELCQPCILSILP